MACPKCKSNHRKRNEAIQKLALAEENVRQLLMLNRALMERVEAKTALAKAQNDTDKKGTPDP